MCVVVMVVVVVDRSLTSLCCWGTAATWTVSRDPRTPKRAACFIMLAVDKE